MSTMLDFDDLNLIVFKKCEHRVCILSYVFHLTMCISGFLYICYVYLLQNICNSEYGFFIV